LGCWPGPSLLGQPKAVKAMLRDDSALGEERQLGDFAKLLQVRH
jgi:hypothetical protein